MLENWYVDRRVSIVEICAGILATVPVEAGALTESVADATTAGTAGEVTDLV
jgi:hypothetical protein